MSRPGKHTVIETHSHLLEEWDWDKNNELKLYPNEVFTGSSIKINWICKKNKEHVWENKISERTRKNPRGCPFCAGKCINHTNCLSATHYHLLEEWDKERNENMGLFPEKITKGNRKKAFWICKKNKEHKWQGSIRNRCINAVGCPFCRGLKVNQTNCFSTTHPNLMLEWDTDRNKKNGIFPEKITAGNDVKINWICSKNPEHRWTSALNSRTRKKNPSNCPWCSNRKINHTNCLSTTHPHLLQEWDFKRNLVRPDEISYGSNKKIFWICSKNSDHKWEATITDRTRKNNKNTGCPRCSLQFSRGHQEVVEYIKTLYFGELFVNNKKILKNPQTGYSLELDIYLPEINLAIEYNGNYFHSTEEVKKRDKIKKQLCEEKGIKLITIWENDWQLDQDKNKILISNYLERIRRIR